ncbi:MAG: YjdF family protein [Sporomusa sp.]
MQKIESKLTIYFDNPFWVGVYERISDGLLEVCKITFGAEPKDYEVYEYLLKNWHFLQFSSLVKADETHNVNINKKRMQREIKKQLEAQGVGTKSQQALKLQHEENKVVRKTKCREQREAKKQMQFELRQQKKKQKHKGH